MSIMGPPGGRHPNTIRDQAAVALAELPVHLRQIGISLQRLADQNERHHYTLAPARTKESGEQVWGVFCLACSDKARDYVWPCEQKADRVDSEDHPPQFLVAGGQPTEEEPTST